MNVSKTQYRSVLFLTCLLSLMLFSSVPTMAADEPAEQTANTSSISQPATKPEFSRIGFSYWGAYAGPAVTQPVNKGGVDSSTGLFDPNAVQGLASQFRLDYNFDENVFAGPILNFQINPFVGGTQTIYMLDSGVRVGHRHIIHTDDWNLSADFRVMAPGKPSYRKNDEVLDLQSLQVLTYKIPRTQWTLGVVGFHYLQLYGSAVPTKNPLNPLDPRDWNLYFAPNVSYQVTKTLAATLWYEVYPYHKLGGNLSDWGADPCDIAPGVSWDLTPNINISPQVMFYPNHLTMNSVGTVVYLFATFI